MRLVHPLLLSLRPLLLSAFVPRRMEFFAGGVLEKPSQAVPLFTAEDERRARERVAPSADGGDDGALTVATWNLLAPPFYRHPSGGREAEQLGASARSPALRAPVSEDVRLARLLQGWYRPSPATQRPCANTVEGGRRSASERSRSTTPISDTFSRLRG